LMCKQVLDFFVYFWSCSKNRTLNYLLFNIFCWVSLVKGLKDISHAFKIKT